ncbi:MAG TPA: hypothetical protein VFZ21_08325 [Gemmatimonadaceae bacterium]|jgi:hypothetical protein|nr:hypothetical protein [Gemmatimonadaceae bacterium]
MALTHDARRALAERVQRRVEGRGIPRQVIDDAVTRVADALDQYALPPRSDQAEGDAAPGPIVAVFTAPSMPDLGSRVRAALEREAVTPLAFGLGASGRHTVAAVRLTADARPAAERAAAHASVSVSFVADSSTISSLSQ